MSVPNFVPIHWVDVAIFPRICEMFDLVVNVCTKFHCKSSVNSCQDISINTANCGPQSCTIRKVRSSQKSLEFVLHEWPWMSVTNFLWIHPQIVEISQSGNCRRWFFFLLTSYYLVLTRTQQHRSKILWAQERKKNLLWLWWLCRNSENSVLITNSQNIVFWEFVGTISSVEHSFSENSSQWGLWVCYSDWNIASRKRFCCWFF